MRGPRQDGYGNSASPPYSGDHPPRGLESRAPAPSFNPASTRARSSLQSGPRCATRPHRTLQIQAACPLDSIVAHLEGGPPTLQQNLPEADIIRERASLPRLSLIHI